MSEFAQRISATNADGASAPAGMAVQPKLRVGAANDRLETEADQVAAHVVGRLWAGPEAIAVADVGAAAGAENARVQRSASVRQVEPAGSPALDIQRRAIPTIGRAGGAVDSDTETRIVQASGRGRPIEGELRRSFESGFGADFSGVRLHTDAGAHELNQRIQAKAFTSGSDIFFSNGAYQPGTRAGQELLAHELSHTVQQGSSGAIQRVFRPATTTRNAHLRDDGQWGRHVGQRIDSGSEIVVDKADVRTQVQPRTFRSDKTTRWVKAVDETGATYMPGAAAAAATYVRETSVGPDKDYGADGIRVPEGTHKPPARHSAYRMRLKWLPTIGEYIEFEESVSYDDAIIVKHNDTFQRLRNNRLEPLDPMEQLQLDSAATRTYLLRQVKEIISAAGAGHHWGELLASDANVDAMTRSDDGAKAIRIDEFIGSARSNYVSWFHWVTNPDGPLSRIRQGAGEVRASLQHWRRRLYPADWRAVRITGIRLTGSDLHETGLGAMFVTFTKPAGGHADYSGTGPYEVVIKPEARKLEQELFGDHDHSLANDVSDIVGLAGVDRITTYRQEVHDRYGTMCEKVIGTQAKSLPGPAPVVSQAMKEALVFVMMTGLSDQHGENVIWDANGRPYMIDADNALKLKYMTTAATTSIQNGFLLYAGGGSPQNPTLRGVMNKAVGYETSILEQLQNPTSDESERLLLRVKQAFAGQTGRTVPIETSLWGQRLQEFIVTPNEGAADLGYDPGRPPTTRWEWCHKWAATVPTGQGAAAPGLDGETGRADGTDGEFDADAEAAAIHADFTVGQIPFYNYRYGDGAVFHNGVRIWSGQSLAARMAGLFALFPNQVQA